MNKVLIIAELGVNHNGDEKLAMKMVKSAAEAGADIIKFHSYKAESVMTEQTPLADYMKNSGSGSFIEMARKYELDEAAIRRLKDYTESCGAEFLSSPFDLESVCELQNLGVKRLKVPSGELVNPPMLKALAESRLPLIVSTGMATLHEVKWAVNFLKEHASGDISLLHCLSQYPAEFQYANLNAIKTLQENFDIEIGYSDHTPGIEASVAAVALGATILEKHFTLDCSLEGPDQNASLEPVEFKRLVDAVRHIELAMGNGIKEPAKPEIANRAIV
ncbi:MAG: N-acetylneuraminate synthase family protein, partial [Lentisphaeria bacterium]|nr:N-acetylneuraminate synthase family protein [Lentisphaeria bacterium]